MPPDKPNDIKARTWVIVVITVAVLALIGAIFNGAWIGLFGGDVTPESTETGSGEIYALQTQVALQATLIAQQSQVNQKPAGSPTITYQDDSANSSPLLTNQGELPTAPSIDCGILVEGAHHDPTLGTNWAFEVANEDRIIHIWSNHWDPNLPEYKYFLPAGQSITFRSGGGSFWSDQPGCDGVAEELYRRDSFQEITFDQYQRYVEQGIIP